MILDTAYFKTQIDRGWCKFESTQSETFWFGLCSDPRSQKNYSVLLLTCSHSCQKRYTTFWLKTVSSKSPSAHVFVIFKWRQLTYNILTASNQNSKLNLRLKFKCTLKNLSLCLHSVKTFLNYYFLQNNLFLTWINFDLLCFVLFEVLLVAPEHLNQPL